MDRAQQAIDYIVRCCPHMGAYSGTFEPHAFLLEVAEEIAGTKPSLAFPDRYAEHVAYALEMVASNWSLSSPAAVATLYLATRFEFYFRVLSGKLKPDGTWLDKQSQDDVRRAIPDSRLGKNRISNLSLAYQIMKLDQSRPLAQRCQQLDSALCAVPTAALGRSPIRSVGDRIAFSRHSAGHGHWGDISSEGVFCGLMTALVFYSQ